MYNKIYILVSIGLIVIGLLMPKYFEHKNHWKKDDLYCNIDWMSKKIL